MSQVMSAMSEVLTQGLSMMFLIDCPPRDNYTKPINSLSSLTPLNKTILTILTLLSITHTTIISAFVTLWTLLLLCISLTSLLLDIVLNLQVLEGTTSRFLTLVAAQLLISLFDNRSQLVD